HHRRVQLAVHELGGAGALGGDGGGVALLVDVELAAGRQVVVLEFAAQRAGEAVVLADTERRLARQLVVELMAAGDGGAGIAAVADRAADFGFVLVAGVVERARDAALAVVLLHAHVAGDCTFFAAHLQARLAVGGVGVALGAEIVVAGLGGHAGGGFIRLSGGVVEVVGGGQVGAAAALVV